MFQRPKAGETEEDLLRLQENFLQSKIKPSATLSKPDDEKPMDIEEKPTYNMMDHVANTFEVIPSNTKIGDIVEKSLPQLCVSKFSMSKRGFPQAKRRDPSLTGTRGSIFAQQIKKLKTGVDEGTAMSSETLVIKENVERLNASPGIQNESFPTFGKDKEVLHNENVNLLSTMSEEEILTEKAKLIETTDPAIVAFLKDRWKSKQPQVETRPSIAEQNNVEDVQLQDIQTTTDILMQPHADEWLNFDIAETNKLAWMKDVDIAKIKKDGVYEARFNFDGWLLPYTQPDIDEKTRILYHHGDEPGRPGYTLQELFQLCRSSVIQQKVIALNTIANILSLQTSGIYEDVLEIPVEQIFFVLRFCLDDNTPAVLNAAIKAIRNLFYNTIDETCLESLLGFGLGETQPILPIDADEAEDDKTVNDQQLAETNLVKCLARTDILIRIRYIITIVKPSTETVAYCLEILTRLVRDSNFIMMQVYKCEDLLKSIIQSFAPLIFTSKIADMAYRQPLVQAIKFLKILCTRSITIANALIYKYNIMDAVATYLSNEFVSTNANGIKLQIESMHLWSVLINYNLAVDYFVILQPVLLRMLNHHVQSTNLELSTSYVLQAHVSSLLVLIGNICKKQNFKSVSSFVTILTNMALEKWTSQFGVLKEMPCGKLQIISALLYCLSQLSKHGPSTGDVPFEKINRSIKNLLDSPGFANITANIKTGSNILSEFETIKSGANLKSVESAVWNAAEHIIPTLQTHSSIPFLCALSDFVQNCGDNQLKQTFLQHKNVAHYLNCIRSSRKYYMTENWFTRIESQLLMNVLKISIVIRKEVEADLFYELAVRCLSIFNSEQKPDVEYILFNIIFSTDFYPAEVLLDILEISDHECDLKAIFRNLGNICDVYKNVLGLKTNIPNFTSCQCVDIKMGNVIPVDWIYSPIIVLYSEQQQNNVKLTEDQQVHIVLNSLRWIFIYESYFPNLAAMINATDRFCRLACVFLGSDSLFLNVEIQHFLNLCLRHLVDKEQEINFDKDIQGLSSFQDFYIQLLEQYQGVSYGNTLFGNFILLPLAQRHNIKWRKTLWSEYAGVVQIFNVTREQSLFAYENFVNPPEDDMSLLKCYRRALVSGCIRRPSILKEVANHHVNAYIEKAKK